MKRSNNLNLALALWRARVSVVLSLFVLITSSPCLANGTGTSFGINIWNSTYYNTDDMYVDLFMHSTRWYNNSTTLPLTLTADGYPTSGSATALMDTFGYPTGVYQFSGKGAFTFNFRNGLIPGTTQKMNGITTAAVQITARPPNFGSYDGSGIPQPELLCDIKATDPNDPPQEFHLISPGYKPYPNTNATFTKEYLQALSPFTCIRLVQWMGTMNSTVTTWASRPQPNFFGQNNAGCAYERFIELANTLNRDIWINIPLYATDDWAVGMANLLKTTLKPGLHVYIEYSNELWNYGGPAFYPDAHQIEVWDQTNPTLISPTNSWRRHGEEVAYQLMHFVQIMQPIMGSQARFILAGQFGNIYSAGGLYWINKFYGPPSNYLYAIASATYWGGSGTDLDSLFTSLSNNLSQMEPTIKQEVALAKQYNLKYCNYEGGQSLFAQSAAQFSLYQAAQQDPRMAALYTTYAQMLNRDGVDLCNFFSFICEWSGGSQFFAAAPDIRETVTNPTVKYTVQAAIAKNGRQNITVVDSGSSSKMTKAQAAAAAKVAELKAKAAAKAGEAKARAAAKAAKIKAAEARATAEAAKHKKHTQ